ncbi:MAG: hypothetical protein JST12_09430 [Armatimonadetes bacterium]|nr:hypothetical protein [Armatimonadota bacterium]
MSTDPERPELPSDEEIEARLAKIRDNLGVDLDDVDSKLDDILANTRADRLDEEEHDAYQQKLDELDEKIRKAKATRATSEPKRDSFSGGLDQKSSLSMGLGLTLAYTIIGAPIVGYGAGLLMNKLTGAQGWQIWLTLLGSIIGIGWVAMVTNRHGNRL